MPRLQDLNDARRAYAFSGSANVGDVPFLYPFEGGGGEVPLGLAGTGPGAATSSRTSDLGGGDAGGAGVGFSGPADTGMRELGFGFIGGDEFGGASGRLRELARRIDGAGTREGIGFEGGTLDDYIDLSGWPDYALEALGLLPGPLGMVSSVVGTGLRGANVNRLDAQLREAGFVGGLTTLQQLGGALGFNNYGEGSWEGNLAGSAAAQRNVYDGSAYVDPSGYKTSPAGPLSRGGRDPGAPEVAGSAFESLGPQRAMERATRSLGFFDRGRDGGSGGGAESGGRRGGNVGDTPGERGPGGRNTFHSGGHLSEGMVPGRSRADVPITAQEGEYVMTADAVDIFGPEFFGRLNRLADLGRSALVRTQQGFER